MADLEHLNPTLGDAAESSAEAAVESKHFIHEFVEEDIATGGRVRETADGGILLPARRDPAAAAGEMEPLLRGGTTIGYLERLAVAVGVIAGYPEAIAVIVAIKGIGRFSELAAAEARVDEVRASLEAARGTEPPTAPDAEGRIYWQVDAQGQPVAAWRYTDGAWTPIPLGDAVYLRVTTDQLVAGMALIGGTLIMVGIGIGEPLFIRYRERVEKSVTPKA